MTTAAELHTATEPPPDEGDDGTWCTTRRTR